MNRSPHKARLGKKLRGKPGDMAELQKTLWYALKLAQGVLDQAHEEELILRAVHAVSQCVGQYEKLLEIE